MTDDDFDDWLDDPDELPPNPTSRAGALAVPGTAINNDVIKVEHDAFLADDSVGGILMLVAADEETGREIVTNTEAFRARGYRGGDDAEELEQWLASLPRDSKREAELNRAILKARGDL